MPIVYILQIKNKLSVSGKFKNIGSYHQEILGSDTY